MLYCVENKSDLYDHQGAGDLLGEVLHLVLPHFERAGYPQPEVGCPRVEVGVRPHFLQAATHQGLDGLAGYRAHPVHQVVGL